MNEFAIIKPYSTVFTILTYIALRVKVLITFPTNVMTNEVPTTQEPVSPAEAAFQTMQSVRVLRKKLTQLKEDTCIDRERTNGKLEELRSRVETTRVKIAEVLEEIESVSRRTQVQDGEVAPGVPRFREVQDEEMQEALRQHEAQQTDLETQKSRINAEIADTERQVLDLLEPTKTHLSLAEEHLASHIDGLDEEDTLELSELQLEELTGTYFLLHQRALDSLEQRSGIYSDLAPAAKEKVRTDGRRILDNARNDSVSVQDRTEKLETAIAELKLKLGEHAEDIEVDV